MQATRVINTEIAATMIRS